MVRPREGIGQRSVMVRRTEADFSGKIVLVYFGFTYCPDICPSNLMAIGDALNALGGDVDQVRDRSHLKDNVTTFHPTPTRFSTIRRDVSRLFPAPIHLGQIATTLTPLLGD